MYYSSNNNFFPTFICKCSNEFQSSFRQSKSHIPDKWIFICVARVFFSLLTKPNRTTQMSKTTVGFHRTTTTFTLTEMNF